MALTDIRAGYDQYLPVCRCGPSWPTGFSMLR